MPVCVSDLEGDELREQRNLIRNWLQEELLPLAERVADRTDADAGAQRHMPAIVKGLLDANVEQEVTADLLQAFEDDNELEAKDRELTLVKMRSAVTDLATMSHCMRVVDGITDACPFNDTTCTQLNLDEFMETKYKGVEKYLVTSLLKHFVSYMYIESADEEVGSEDSDDEADDDDDDDKAGIEKDSDDDEEDDDREEGSESGEPDSDAEEKMLNDAVEESDDDEAAPAAKRAKTEE